MTARRRPATFPVVRLFLSMLFSIFGLMLLATPALPIGLMLLYAAWWVYEKTGGRGDDEAFTGILMLLGGLGAALVFVTWAWDAVRTLL